MTSFSISSGKLVSSKDGTLICADAAGNPKNPGIVFLHGLSLNATCFNDAFANANILKQFYLVSVSPPRRPPTHL